MVDKPHICPECGIPCEAKECDDGIGPYEYWGRQGHDSRPYMGSDCCEAQLDDAEFPEPPDYEPEWRDD